MPVWSSTGRASPITRNANAQLLGTTSHGAVPNARRGVMGQFVDGMLKVVGESHTSASRQRHDERRCTSVDEALDVGER
jgi:hypothetical protein